MKYTILAITILLLLSGCADVQPNLEPCLTGQTYGFFAGVWHGTIAPIAFIGSLFDNDIAVWGVNNNGGWYAFGFVSGASGFIAILRLALAIVGVFIERIFG